VLPLEIIAASLTTSYWNAHVNKSAFVTIFLILIIAINMFGVKGYGEAEFVFAIVKVTAVVGFMYGTQCSPPHPASSLLGTDLVVVQ
jgi:amino acid transporter